MLVGAAAADTIHFKDGSSLDGRVKRETPLRVILELPRGQMSFPMTDVERIEQNDRLGVTETPPVPETPPRPPLSQEDRVKLREMLRALLAADPAARDAARQQIRGFAQTRDVFTFLDPALPYMPDRQAAEVLQLLYDLDAPRAAPILRKALTNKLSKIRAKALELLGALNAAQEPVDPQLLQLIARGMLDYAEEVQLAAVRALQAAADKRATPVLINGLESPNTRVQHASLTALQSIWGSSGVLADVDSIEAWRGLLSLTNEATRTGLDPEQLEPLVEAPHESDADYNLTFE